LRVAALPGLSGSRNSGGGGGRNEPESQPVEIIDAASMAAITAAPTLVPRTCPCRVVVLFNVIVLWLFSRDRWDRPGFSMI
jgi:hypothetical protein